MNEVPIWSSTAGYKWLVLASLQLLPSIKAMALLSPLPVHFPPPDHLHLPGIPEVIISLAILQLLPDWTSRYDTQWRQSDKWCGWCYSSPWSDESGISACEFQADCSNWRLWLRISGSSNQHQLHQWLRTSGIRVNEYVMKIPDCTQPCLSGICVKKNIIQAKQEQVQ